MKATSFLIGGIGGVVGLALTRSLVRTAARRSRESGEVHADSLTAITGEALRRGTANPRFGRHEPEIPGQEELLQVGDPDVDALDSAYVGDEAPGGDMTTPDQDRVDDIGRAFGVSEADSGELRSTAELLAARDRHR